VISTDHAFGGAVKLGGAVAKKVFTCLNTKFVCEWRWASQKRGYLLSSKKWLFFWSNYAIFAGKTTVWKRFISSIQKRFEKGPKQWASFFTR